MNQFQQKSALFTASFILVCTLILSAYSWNNSKKPIMEGVIWWIEIERPNGNSFVITRADEIHGQGGIVKANIYGKLYDDVLIIEDMESNRVRVVSTSKIYDLKMGSDWEEIF